MRSSDFGGGLAKKGCASSRAIASWSTMPARSYAAVGIERLARASPHEVIEQRVARSGIACNQFVAVDISHVGDTADIEHRDRPRLEPEPARKRAVIHWRERRALPACGHVGGAEVINNRNAEPAPPSTWPSPI